MTTPTLKSLRKLKDGRWQVERTDGARLSLTVDEWSMVSEVVHGHRSGLGIRSIELEPARERRRFE
ncbi:MAG TPA: hypothetical protein VE907_12870 [Gammaproteobacteria bacterium]|nr:hypothetical protein [Gammaproteobacteria bacterium]